MLKNRSLIAPTDFTVSEIDEIIALANDIIQKPDHYMQACKGKLLASIFYEPSTRTKFSFDSAMYRLGGNVIGFSDPSTSSAAKGETLADCAKIFSQYADVLVIRHPKEGTARLFSQHADCPVINAGDGGHQHPTQTLTDLLTISQFKGKLNNMTIGVCGDLKFGRTIHSLVGSMSRYDNINFIFISPNELKMPSYIIEELDKKHIKYTETSNLEESIPHVDVLYMSRVQRERFVSEEEYLRLKDFFILTSDKMALAKPDMIVLHPLPRVTEIATEVDSDPRAKYFEQAKFGMYVRMALILKLLGIDETKLGGNL